MYWITRDWARECLRRFVRPLTAIETDQIRTAELITRESRGLVAYPPLGIEELSGSTICPEAGDANHAEALEVGAWRTTHRDDDDVRDRILADRG